MQVTGMNSRGRLSTGLPRALASFPGITRFIWPRGIKKEFQINYFFLIVKGCQAQNEHIKGLIFYAHMYVFGVNKSDQSGSRASNVGLPL